MSPAVFIEPESLAKLEGRLLFYPTAGCDWSELTELFADHVDEFRFVDIAYDLRRELQPLFTEPSGFRKLQTVHEGDRAARIEQRNAETGRPYRFLKPACQIDVYERTRDTRRVTVIRRRGFGQYALAELPDNSIGIFVHRGDSPGEGGSNTHFLANRRRDHEPCSDLFNKLVRKLANRALIVSDGSNTSITFLRKFHNADVSGAKAFAELRDETFCHSPFRWRCVGHLSERYGPTLVWEVAQTGGAHTRSQTAA